MTGEIISHHLDVKHCFKSHVVTANLKMRVLKIGSDGEKNHD